jgi:dTDP-4-amino-4,6-dideoxygalactose transaminase
VRRLRDHGQQEKYLHAEEGWNGRLDALQAAILRVKLRHVADWNDKRRTLASLYRDRLARWEARGALRLPSERQGSRHVYHQFVARIPSSGSGAPDGSRRDRLRRELLEDGIETGVHYPIPLHRQPCYAAMGLEEGSFPESEQAAREVLSLPLHPFLPPADVERVCQALTRRLGA